MGSKSESSRQESPAPISSGTAPVLLPSVAGGRPADGVALVPRMSAAIVINFLRKVDQVELAEMLTVTMLEYDDATVAAAWID